MTQSQTCELLERATADLRPSTDVVAGGIALGRRRRRRGRALAAAGVVAAAGLVGGTLVSWSGGGSEADVAADPSAATGWSWTFHVPSVVPVEPPAHQGPFPVAPDAMASTLEPLLDGAVTHPQNIQDHPATPDGSQSGAVDLDGATVSVAYQHSTGPRCDGDLGLSSCREVAGGWLGTYTAEITQTGVGLTGAVGRGVTLYTPDGFTVSVTAMNAGSADPTLPVMDEPVLTLSELTAIAQDPAWR